MSPSSFEPVFIQSTLSPSSPSSVASLQSKTFMKSERQQNEKPDDIISYYYYSGTSSPGAEKPTKLRKEDRMTERQRLNSSGCSSRLEKAKEIARKSQRLLSSASMKMVSNNTSTKDFNYHNNLIEVTENSAAVLSNIKNLYHEHLLTTGNVIDKDNNSPIFPTVSSTPPCSSLCSPTSSSSLLNSPYLTILQQHQLYGLQQYLQSYVPTVNSLPSSDLFNTLLPFYLNYLTPINSIQYIQQLTSLHQNSINNIDSSFNISDFYENKTSKTNKKLKSIYLNSSDQQIENYDHLFIQSNNNYHSLNKDDSISLESNSTKNMSHENDQVNEHFKRSLGTYYETVIDKTEHSHECNNNTYNNSNATTNFNNTNNSELKIKHFKNDIRKIDVDDHFAKALGDETWKKLKTTNHNTENSFNYELGMIKKIPQTLS